ncbi:MAG: DEAD/DEAH box helicase [Candidatus Thermoplasmatota archaeon]|nr:DEAD/DEAH box helicase [Candidatus Thermoplasmatota archaeon]
MYVEEPGVVPNLIEERAYQKNIVESAKSSSTLVVLPTGMGKTVIALRLVAHVLQKEGGKVLFMAPTKPLVVQHSVFLREGLVNPGAINVFTGEVSPSQRKELWNSSRIICSTPQVIVNDLISGRIDLKEVGLMVVDEAHRAVGDYAYVFVGERYALRPGGLVLATTASPGSDVSKILEVCQNLGIEHVEIRSKFDADVLQYVHGIDMKWESLELPPGFKRIIGVLKESMADMVKELKRYGITIVPPVSTKALLACGQEIRMGIKENPNQSSLYQAAVVQAAAVKINHAVELAETQGLDALRAYMGRIIDEAGSRKGGKASRMISSNRKILDIMALLEKEESEHPKIAKAIDVVSRELGKNPDSRVILFTHYRETSEIMVKRLQEITGARPVRFVGQASKGEDKGLRQKQQVQTLQEFRDGKYNVLVATSVAEEGLDIPATDLVVFYEPVPSEIRSIQRRGRTGRKRRGKVVILMAKGTRDQGYYYSSLKKEKTMHQELQNLRRDLARKLSVGDIYRQRVLEQTDEGEGVDSTMEERVEGSHKGYRGSQRLRGEEEMGDRGSNKGQTTLASFDGRHAAEGGNDPMAMDEGPLRVVVDTREFNSSVVKELSRKGVEIESVQLPVGDYIISSAMAVERKEVADFLTSLMDGRLFSQMADLSKAYMQPVLILEGEGLFQKKNVSKQSIYGALASIGADFRIPVYSTKGPEDTADFIYAMASRGRKAQGRKDHPHRHGKPGTSNVRDSQLFIVEGLPGVSSVAARKLLEHFGSVEKIFSASQEELMEVKGIGQKTASNIVLVSKSGYR